MLWRVGGGSKPGAASQPAQIASTQQELARLSDALADATHRAGMAETVVGALHDVGNALTSVVVAATIVREASERFEGDRMRQALAMVASGAKDAEGSETAHEYLARLNEKHIAILATIQTEVDTILRRLDETEHAY